MCALDIEFKGAKIIPLKDIVIALLPQSVQLFLTPWTTATGACLSLTICRSLPKFMSIASVMTPCHLIL